MYVHVLFRFIHWTETAPETGLSSLHQLNLRNVNSTSTTQLSAAQMRRRKRSGRERRETNLNVLSSLTSALAQDPRTGELLVCDSGSGDILRCNVTDGSCIIEVDSNTLVLPNEQTNNGTYNICQSHCMWANSINISRVLY